MDTGEHGNSPPSDSQQSSLTIELSALTAAALRTRLQERNLPATGNKATLIERLTQSSNDNPATQRERSTTATHETPSGENPPGDNSSDTPHTTATIPTNIPASLLAQLATYLQPAPEAHQRRTTPGAGHAFTDDQLSDASELQHNARQELPAAITGVLPPPQVNPQYAINPAVTVQGTNPIAPPSVVVTHRSSLPPVTPRILEKIRKGEYIDFSTLTTKSMFGASEPTSQTSFTLELTPSGDSFAIQPTGSHKRVTSFPAWLESWNIYLAIMVDHDPAKASELIAYQAIITSASRQYPLHAWLNYDTQFRITAASVVL